MENQVRRPLIVTRALARLFLFTTLACNSSSEQSSLDDKAAGKTRSDAIVNGSAPGPIAYRLGPVMVGNCSGTLITNRHVLTAGHCPAVSSVGFVTPTGLQVIPVAANDVRSSSIGDTDMAVLTLGTPALVDGRSDNINRRVVDVAVGNNIECLGFGCNSPFYGTCSGFGVLRRATMTVTGILGMTETQRNGLGQVATSGDSGSTCFVIAPGQDSETSPTIGVESYAYYDIFDSDRVITAHYTPFATTKEWVESRTRSAITVTTEFVPEKSPSWPFQTFVYTNGTEIAGYVFDGSNSATWANAIPRSGWFRATSVLDSYYSCDCEFGTGQMSGFTSARVSCLSHALVGLVVSG